MKITKLVRIALLAVLLGVAFYAALTNQVMEGSSPEISKVEIKGSIQPSTSRFIGMAMAPGINIGAAVPIDQDGNDLGDYNAAIENYDRTIG